MFYCSTACVCVGLTHMQTQWDGWADFGPVCKSQRCDPSGGGVRTAANKEQGCYSVTELQSDSRLMTTNVQERHSFCSDHVPLQLPTGERHTNLYNPNSDYLLS